MQAPIVIHYHQLNNVPVPIQALCEAGLSPTQWVLLYLIHHKELRSEILAMIHCPNKPLLWTQEDFQDLIDRFFLIHEPVPGAATLTDLVNFRCSERFTDLLGTLKPAWLPIELATPQEASATLPSENSSTRSPQMRALDTFDELFRAYPSHIPIRGTLMSGRGGDYDGMAANYSKALAVKSSPTHTNVLELVEWAKQNNLLTMGLHKFIASREWLGLQELRDSGYKDSHVV